MTQTLDNFLFQINLYFNTFKATGSFHCSTQKESRAVKSRNRLSVDQSHENWELDRQLLMTVRHVTHVLILHDVFVVDKYTRVPRVPVAAIVVHVQLLVVVAVIGTRAAPRRECADVCLWPRVVRVVHSQRWNSGAIEIVRIECIPIQLQFRLLGRLVA